MKKEFAVAAAMSALALLAVSCGGSGSGDGGSDKGTLTIEGSSTSLAREVAPLGAIGTEVGSPTSFNIDLYKIYLSKNEDCSNATLIKASAEPVSVDIMDSPVLFTGNVAAGTYKCVIFKTGDIFTFTPDQAAEDEWGASVCNTGVSYDFDILKDEEVAEVWYNLDTGTTTTGQGGPGASVEQTVFLYASTDSAAIGSPVHDNQRVTLSAPFTISSGGNKTLVFYTNVTDTIRPYGEYCWVEGFSAGFYVQE